jgi:hypothetical protein
VWISTGSKSGAAALERVPERRHLHEIGPRGGDQVDGRAPAAFDVTYRLYDYGRPRELHLDAALAAARLEPWRPSTHRGISAKAGSCWRPAAASPSSAGTAKPRFAL